MTGTQERTIPLREYARAEEVCAAIAQAARDAASYVVDEGLGMEEEIEYIDELQEDMEDIVDSLQLPRSIIESRRYLCKSASPPSKTRHDDPFARMDWYLGPSCSEVDFERNFRMKKLEFHHLVDRIKDHKVF
jgi:hypothetical protein